MGVVKEKCIPVNTIPFFKLCPALSETTRIRQPESLNHELLVESVTPNVIQEVNINNHPWSVVAVLSPYSSLFHVMVVDLSKRYNPDPVRIENQEGNELMSLWSEIAEFQKGIRGTEAVHIGYNCSPRSFGVEEEKGGFQTMVTKIHPQFWNSEKATEFVSLNTLVPSMQMALKGNSYNRLFGEFLKDFLERQEFGILDLDKINIDNRGIKVDLNKDLVKALRSNEFFSGFLKPIAVFLDDLACNMTKAVSSLDLRVIDQIIENSFVSSTNGILPFLRQDPRLLSFEERIKRIKELVKLDYPQWFIDRLLVVNSHLRNREEVKEERWFRKGLGYALVITENLVQRKTSLRVMPAVFVEARGGVVEAEGVALFRPAKRDNLTKEEQKTNLLKDREKRKQLFQLRKRLAERLQPVTPLLI